MWTLTSPKGIISLIFGVILVGFFEFSAISTQAQSMFRSSILPVQTEIHQLGQSISASVNTLALLLTMQDSRDTSKQSASELESVRARIQILEEENEQLRKQAGLPIKPENSGLLLTTVLSTPYRYVAAGSNSGVRVGALVLADSTVVGMISFVESDVSKVTLIQEDSSVLLVGITNNAQKGLLRAKDGKLLFTEVPHSSTVSIGDRVLTAGQDGVKSGLLVGVVAENATTPTDPMQTFVLSQLSSFDTATMVELLL